MTDTGWNEFFIPLETINIENIQITKPSRQVHHDKAHDMLYTLAYSADDFSLTSIPILTPYMKIHSWDSSTGRLELEAESDSTSYTKFSRIQELFFDYLSLNIDDFRKYGIFTKMDLFNTFQQIIYKNIFVVYLHGVNPQQKHNMGRVWVLGTAGWEKGVSVDTFKKGQQVRIAFRFQGISYSPGGAASTGKIKCRLQHQTVAVIPKQVI
jgi:hypothetical protein